MAAIIIEFSLQAVGTTKDETESLVREKVWNIQNDLGGMPWIMIDDDTNRLNDPRCSVSDEQGFFYRNQTRLMFRGPTLIMPGQMYNPGLEPQNSVKDL